MFDQYDRIRIVNLKERRDRRREMVRELAKAGLAISNRIQFFDAIRTSSRGPFRRAGSHGAYLSHLEILVDAAAVGESVMILQDDCEFLPGIAGFQVSPGTDIFYGGYEANNPDDLENSDIAGAHFMGFSAIAADMAVAYLRCLLADPDLVDQKAATEPDFDPVIRPPIDGALVWFRRAHPELLTQFAMLSRQRPSRSDITPQGMFDRLPGLRKMADWYRAARTRIRGRSK